MQTDALSNDLPPQQPAGQVAGHHRRCVGGAGHEPEEGPEAEHGAWPDEVEPGHRGFEVGSQPWRPDDALDLLPDGDLEEGMTVDVDLVAGPADHVVGP